MWPKRTVRPRWNAGTREGPDSDVSCSPFHSIDSATDVVEAASKRRGSWVIGIAATVGFLVAIAPTIFGGSHGNPSIYPTLALCLADV